MPATTEPDPTEIDQPETIGTETKTPEKDAGPGVPTDVVGALIAA
ncbi:hypothetical protein [Streptomyces lydicamycinicus]